LWERDHPEYRRVEQRDWDHPDPQDWVTTLDDAVRDVSEPVILVGHSLGCTTIARWATTRPALRVAAGMLVAPSDVEAPTAPVEVRSFAPIPLAPLRFPTILVASADDPWVSMERAAHMAARWGCRLVTIGAAGHIHTAAGYGPWPEGHLMLTELLDTVPLRRLTGA
jgi:hypothetical protein